YNWQQADAVLDLQGAETENGARWQVAPMRHPSGYIAINEELVREPASIAASFSEGARPGESGDGEAALQIASIRNTTVMLGQTATLDDFFAQQVATIGLKGEEAQTSLDSQELLMKDLRDTRASISGVSIDEEIAQMMKYQHGYQAAARFISNVDQMLDTIINRMGA
ncbi:MAG: flagellar basal body rod C-terminal domain-containing protein, partial [Alkalispirochaetaceae bacterium]